MRRSKRKNDRPPIVDGTTTPWGALADEVSQRDRVYFETHPGITNYIRPRVPGEFGPYEDQERVQIAREVEVTQIRPGFRTRAPLIPDLLGITFFAEGPNGEAVALEPGMTPWDRALIDQARKGLHRAEQARNNKIASRQSGRHPHKKTRR